APPTAPHSRPGRCGVRRRLRAAGPWSGSTAATGTDPATGTPARPDRGGTAPHPQAGRHRTLIGMLLWMSSGEFKMVWCGDELVELAGDVAFEAADDLLLGHAVFGASFHVGAGAGVPAQAADGDPVERFVGLSVAAAVEAVPVGLAGRGGDRGGAAEHGERRLGSEPVVVVAN